MLDILFARQAGWQHLAQPTSAEPALATTSRSRCPGDAPGQDAADSRGVRRALPPHRPLQGPATLVALKTVIYATLAVLKVLPKGYGLWPHGGRDRRVGSRSLHLEPLARDT